MSNFIDVCLICLKHSNNLSLIESQGTNKTSIEDKLKYFLEYELNFNYPRYICIECANKLSSGCEFKQIFSQNITTYKKYAQQVTTIDSSYKRPDFVFKTEISDENDPNSNISELKSEIGVELIQNGDICLICLKHSNNLLLIESQSTNGTSIEDKLKYFLPEYDSNSNDPKYICIKCANKLSEMYEFKQKCLQNITTYNKNAQQITTTDSSVKSDFMHPELAYVKKEVLELQNEMNVDVVNIEEIIIKEERNEEASPQDIKEDFESGDKYSDFVCKEEISDGNNHDTNKESQAKIVDREEIFIKEETNEKLILDDKLQSLLHEIKQENSKLNDKCNKKYKCKTCNKSFKQLRNLKQHNFTHVDEKSFTCEVCNKSFRHSRSLSNHKVIHTDGRPFTCEICSKSFKRLQNLKEHNSVHVDNKPYTCDFCDKSFRQLKNFRHHKLRHTGEKPFSCEVCNKSFAQLTSLKQHKLVHINEKPFNCDVCNKSFRYKSNFSAHKLLHTDNKPLTCEVCNESFRVMQSLNLHKLVHTGEKPFTCEVCNKSFRQLKNMKRHKLLHSGEKPFICKICNKSFTQLTTLKNHELIHTDEKPFTCDICNKLFRHKNNLNTHKLVHTAEQSLTCEVCNKSFQKLQNLKSHKLIHTGEKPFTCEVCNKPFRQLKNLKLHKLLHTGEKPFICEVCSKSFAQPRSLKKHQLAKKHFEQTAPVDVKLEKP